MTTTEQVPDAVPTPTDITITAMEPEEYPLLAEFLYQAIHVPPGTPTPDRSVVELPELRRYIEGFGRPDDACMVARNGLPNGSQVVGAAWARIFPTTPQATAPSIRQRQKSPYPCFPTGETKA